MKRRLARMGATAAALGLGLTLLAGTSAQAIASGCYWGNEGSFSWAQCTSGSGKYQAWAQCQPRYWWVTNWYMSYGAMVSPRSISTAGCDKNHKVASYGITYG